MSKTVEQVLAEIAATRRVPSPGELAFATKLGAAAYASGLPAAPALNKAFLDFLASLPLKLGDSIPIMEAYLAAWTKANLDAPIPEWSDKENADWAAYRAGLMPDGVEPR